MFSFPRAIESDLQAWSQARDRKPLVLRGARQTGKTSIIRQLGHSFDLFVELNLERHQDRRLVDACTSVEDLLMALKVRHNIARFPPRTLIFFDEIQAAPVLINWLRFFYEDHAELHIVAAGSLMEVRLTERGFSFPVGRVTFRYLHPLGFLEFLGATGQDVLAGHIRVAAHTLMPPPRPVHIAALDAFRNWLFVGGMPEAVRVWRDDHSPVTVRQVHHDLMQAFAEDIQKYPGVRDLRPLEAAFDAMRHHYGQRFKYEGFAGNLPSQQMKQALSLLEAAMICSRVWPTSDTAPPLAIKQRSAPKLLPLDTGIALSTMGVPALDVQTTALDLLLDGRVAEMAVGQLLLSTFSKTSPELYFWVRDEANAAAEVDYLVQMAADLLPVEVKSGASGSLKSLHQYLWRTGQMIGVRLYGGTLVDERHQVRKAEAHLDYRLLSLPLYMAELVPMLVIRNTPAS